MNIFCFISYDIVAIFELVKYALTLPTKFRNFDWKNAEKEADDDIKLGRQGQRNCLNLFRANSKRK